MIIQYAKGATRPDLKLWLYNEDELLIDFATGFQFTVRIGDRGVPALTEKTTGITGATGTGNADTPGSTPNLAIAWSAGELNIAPGEYTLQINADAGGGTAPRYFFYDFEILDIVLAP